LFKYIQVTALMNKQGDWSSW